MAGGVAWIKSAIGSARVVGADCGFEGSWVVKDDWRLDADCGSGAGCRFGAGCGSGVGAAGIVGMAGVEYSGIVFVYSGLG